MITWFIQQCRLLHRLVTSNDAPKQMAVAAAFGVMLGLIPKGNLLAAAISTCFLALRVNLATGMVVAVAFTFLSAPLDPLFHNIGQSVLTLPGLQSIFATIYQLPFVPWTSFNNTIVFGSCVIGGLAFYPTYRLTLPVFKKWPKRNTIAAEVKSGGETAAAAPQETSLAILSKPPQQLRLDGPQTASPPHLPPSQVPRPGSTRDEHGVREALQKRRFKQFVSEVESISQRRVA
jgi:uncharacterized protein (TIGR03546 family)